jgi:hypothetical protein
MGKVTVGADPEVWLVDISTGKIIPSCGLIGGTKQCPLPLKKGLAKGFTVQEDNVSVEFNIPPAHNLEQFCSYMSTATSALNEYLSSKGPYSFTIASQHQFKKADLNSDQAKLFGCAKDFDAYSNGGEFPVVDPKTLRTSFGGWRFAGGHVHIGYQADDVPPFVAAAFADYFIGMRTISQDNQSKRRNLYGQPGRYRPTSYGIEYRTPSNFWIMDYTTHIGQLAFFLGNYLSDTPVKAVRTAYQKIPWGAVRKAIAESDDMLAANIQNYVADEHLIYSEDDL